MTNTVIVLLENEAWCDFEVSRQSRQLVDCSLSAASMLAAKRWVTEVSRRYQGYINQDVSDSAVMSMMSLTLLGDVHRHCSIESHNSRIRIRIRIRTFTGDTSNDIHSPGPVIWEVSP